MGAGSEAQRRPRGSPHRGLALLGWPRVSGAAGTCSVISLPEQPGEVRSATAAVTDAAGNLYLADTGNNRVQMYSPEP
jgi:hypothetical protein